MMNWKKYQSDTYENKVNSLLIEFLDKYKINTAIDLGCGCGNESVYLLKKDIKVVCIDSLLNKSYILDRLGSDEVENVSFIESSFEEVNLPKTDALMAFFSIPFCPPDKFDLLWDKIYECIEKDGYFVGQLFGNRDAWRHRKDINTFSIKTAKKYLERYEVLKFEEVEYVSENHNKKWHFYNIIAKKI